jgi:NAD(P)-dependent dehydrogenase (short-subunit alcohol dehydrogenase family)
LITGAGSGIGKATALRLARSGATVVLVGRTRARLEDAAAAVGRAGGSALVAVADVRSSAAVDTLAAEVRHELGGLEGLVNNAGIARFEPLRSSTVEAWDDVLAANLTGAFLVTRAFLPLLEKGRAAAIVNVASTLAQQSVPGAGAYCAAKGGLVSWTRALATELGPQGVRVNVVCPGPVATEMLTAAHDAESLARLAERHALGRIGEPEDVASTIAWLLSEDARFVTGATFTVDGGFTSGTRE